MQSNLLHAVELVLYPVGMSIFGSGCPKFDLSPHFCRSKRPSCRSEGLFSTRKIDRAPPYLATTGFLALSLFYPELTLRPDIVRNYPNSTFLMEPIPGMKKKNYRQVKRAIAHFLFFFHMSGPTDLPSPYPSCIPPIHQTQRH